MRYLKVILILIAVAFAFYIGFMSVGEQHTKTKDGIVYNWEAVPKRIIVSSILAVLFGCTGYTVAQLIQYIQTKLKK